MSQQKRRNQGFVSRPCLKKQKSQCFDEPDGWTKPTDDKPGFGFTPQTKKYRKKPYGSCNNVRNICSNGIDRGMLSNGAGVEFDHSKFSWSYPPKSQINSLNYRVTSDLTMDADIEMDAIFTQKVETFCLPHSPKDIPDSVSMISVKDSPMARPSLFFFPKKKADQESVIYITHPGQTETELGDHFGANLKTYYDQKRRYFQHFFSKITPDGVADKMHIKKKDELVLINGEFVPEMNHSQLLNVFHNVPVDGRTRFYLVFRRIVKTRGKGENWQWFETSAILYSEDQTTEIEKFKFTTLENNEKLERCEMRFNIPGTHLYLDINFDTVSVGTLQENQPNNSKIIYQLVKYKQNHDGTLSYESALQGYVGERFLQLSMTNDIVTSRQSTPIWFAYSRVGSKCMFYNKGVYIGFDAATHRIIGKPDEDGFCRKTLEKQHDFPDGLFDQNSKRTSLADSVYSSPVGSSANSSFEDEISSGYDSPPDQKACHVTSSVRRITRSMSRADSIQNSDKIFQKLNVND